MIYTFKRRRLMQGAGALLLFAHASLFALIACLPVFEIVRILAGFAAAAEYVALIFALREVFAPGPILTIGPEGLYYPPAFRETVPWSELSGVKTMRAWRNASGTRNHKGGGVILTVNNLARYKGGFAGAMAAMERSMSGGTQISMAEGSTEDILAAIKTYWQGDVAVVNPPNVVDPA